MTTFFSSSEITDYKGPKRHEYTHIKHSMEFIEKANKIQLPIVAEIIEDTEIKTPYDLVNYHYIMMHPAGYSQNVTPTHGPNRQTVYHKFEKFHLPLKCCLFHEKKNQWDKNALAFMSTNNYSHLGFIPRPYNIHMVNNLEKIQNVSLINFSEGINDKYIVPIFLFQVSKKSNNKITNRFIALMSEE